MARMKNGRLAAVQKLLAQVAGATRRARSAHPCHPCNPWFHKIQCCVMREVMGSDASFAPQGQRPIAGGRGSAASGTPGSAANANASRRVRRNARGHASAAPPGRFLVLDASPGVSLVPRSTPAYFPMPLRGKRHTRTHHFTADAALVRRRLLLRDCGF